MKKSLMKNAAYKAILNLFNLFVPLLVAPYVTSLLEPNLYGIYNRVYAEFQIFLIVGAFGIYNYGVREISKVRNHPQRFRKTYTSLFVFGVFTNVLTTVVYIGYFMFRGTGIDRYVYAVMLIQMLSNVIYIEFVNEAVENYKFIAIKTMMVRVFYVIGIFSFVKKREDVILYAIVISCTILLNNGISFFYLRKKCPFDFRDFEFKRHVFPLFVNLIFVNVELLYSQLDKVLLGWYVSDISVTEYTLPTTLVGMVASLPLALITVAIPRLSQYIGEGNKKAYYSTLKNACTTYMAALVPMSFGVAVLSKEIMWTYTKDTYTYAYPVLIAAGLSRIVYGYQAIMTYLVMYVNGLEKKLTAMLLMGGVVNLVCDFLLILLEIFSPVTALLSTTFSVLVFLTCAWVSMRGIIVLKDIIISRRILGYIGISVLFFAVSYAVNRLALGYIWNMVVEVMVCVTLYAIYLVATKDPIIGCLLSQLKKPLD